MTTIARKRVSCTESLTSLHSVGELVYNLKKRNISTEEIARKVNYLYPDFCEVFKLSLSDIKTRLDTYFNTKKITWTNKYTQILYFKYPVNKMYEKESDIIENWLTLDLLKFLKENNLESRLIGINSTKMSLILKKNEKEQIVQFFSSWGSKFDRPSDIPLYIEDVANRSLQEPLSEDIDPNIKKEIIVSK